MKIGVANFQSLGKVKLDFTGFAVVTGESNLGKSVLVRAVTAILFGYPGEYFIRRGASLAAVGVSFEDGLTIKWQKVPASKKIPGRETTLEINGVAHTKLGRDFFSLVAPHGFLRIDTAAGELRPQVAGQFNPPFMLGIPETAVAEVFKVLGRGDVVSDAKDMAKRDLGRTLSDLKIRESDRVAAEAKVTSLGWVRPLFGEAQALEDSALYLQKFSDLLSSLKELESVELPKEIPEVPPLPDVGLDLKLLARFSGLSLFEVSEVPEVSEIREMGLWSDLCSLEGELDEAVKKEAEIAQTLPTVLREIRELEAEMGVCPTCGKGFDDLCL